MIKQSKIRCCCKAAFSVACLLCLSTTVTAEVLDIKFAKLTGRIVRSVSIANFDLSRVIVGNKGSVSGSATVFASDNGGITWRFLNQNRPLHPAATDVQAVRYLTQKVLLAGTWKHGLFRSIDGGATFGAVDNFSPADVRSLASFAGNPEIVFAATGASGILKSTDYGKTWVTTSLDKGYFWSIREHAGGKVLTASSPTRGLFLSRDQGESWGNILPDVKVSDAIVSEQAPEVIVAATDGGLYLSRDSGSQWRQPNALLGKRLSSVQFDHVDSSVIILGDWNGGIWRYSLTDDRANQYEADLSVIHVESSQRGLVVGTWGSGLHVFPQSADRNYLIVAAKAGDKATVDSLLSAGSNPDVFDGSKNTALIFAARDGNLSIVESLINSGASVNWVDGEGVTPLILAAHKNHPEIVKLLLEHNASVRVVDSFGNMAQDYARRRGKDDLILRLLLQ